ncbi:outer membrane beta-barrel protein [Vibrio astriarenae]|uniref:Outer membrane beta-barrel protein n=1 Tax=Vibrio astriarenae TaxID=1481923 RepID=A0A7Z2T769_9VIBR|nr:outer membrane beta-barrel protein [Vibrio astriarenae]QIA65515.1 outer membrane beta-barrel protein [Vibrio astriarenae]
MRKISLFALMLVPLSANAFSPYNLGAQIGIGSIESSNSTVKGINGSFRVHPYLSAEAGYIEHGNVSAFNGDVDASSFYLAAKPTYPIGRFELHAKAGLNYYDASLSSANAWESGSQSGIGLVLGVGADLFLMRQLSIGASLQSFGMEVMDESARASSLTFNAHYHF